MKEHGVEDDDRASARVDRAFVGNDRSIRREHLHLVGRGQDMGAASFL